MSPAGRFLLVEGGGTRTWATVAGAGGVSGPSTNPISTAADVVVERLTRLTIAALASSELTAPAMDLVLVAHGAAASVVATERYADLVERAMSPLALNCPLVVVNDMFPVVAAPMHSSVVAVIVGTGTGFAARRGLAAWARAGGADHILSDEGGGYDLGQAGLRSVIRAGDGRGHATELVERARAWTRTGQAASLREALYDRVYSGPARELVASFAREVVGAAEDGDPVAIRLVLAAADEIVRGVHAVHEAAGLTGTTPLIVLSGSLALTDSPLRVALLERLASLLPAATIRDHQPEALAGAAGRVIWLLLGQPARLAAIRTAFPVSRRHARGGSG